MALLLEVSSGQWRVWSRETDRPEDVVTIMSARVKTALLSYRRKRVEALRAVHAPKSER
jgi:hypothetical protein